MANSVSINQSVTSIVDGVRTTLSSNTNQSTTSSNFIAGGQAVTASVWTAISLGSLTDVIILTVVNDNSDNTASVITFATGAAGQNPLATLSPGNQAIIPWSGSLPSLYAKVVGGYPTGTPKPNDGDVQWLVQQS